MAGENPSDALGNYVRPMQKAISCLHPNAHLSTDCRDPKDGKTHNLNLAGNEPVRVATVSGSSSYLVYVAQAFEIIRDKDPERGPWRATTKGYMYSVMEDTEAQREIVGFHWHPGEQGFNEAHMHIPDHPSSQMQHAHIPSGRVSIESFVSFLIREFKVKAHQTGYRGILEHSEGRFRRFRNWG